jgi:hypothetical protein
MGQLHDSMAVAFIDQSGDAAGAAWFWAEADEAKSAAAARRADRAMCRANISNLR